MAKIDLTVMKERRERAVQRARERNIILPTLAQMKDPTLIPDKIEEEETQVAQRLGVFGATLVTFFLAKVRDKTQIATVALAAKYSSLIAVVGGTTLGMMLANVPAVLLGEVAAKKLPMRLVHGVAAAIFAVLGLLVLLRADQAL